jgi:hypothetical protein
MLMLGREGEMLNESERLEEKSERVWRGKKREERERERERERKTHEWIQGMKKQKVKKNNYI